MKAVILCGGFGTRFLEKTRKIPKSMIKVNNKPILEHIIKLYLDQGATKILLLLGYKGNIIKKFFKKSKYKNKIIFIDTGINTLTAERILKAKKYLKDQENFMVTYGDGLSNINLKKLIKFHIKHKKIVTLTAVRPPSSFGKISLTKKNLVSKFNEKSRDKNSWINGGFFIFKKSIFKYLLKNKMLETEPMDRLVKNRNLMAYKHTGFWQCMDNKQDKDLLEKILKKNKRMMKVNY